MSRDSRARAVVTLAARDARVMPWKNGRGVTRELAIWPPGADVERGSFEWRISRAAVDEPGAFSTFPGCERLLVVTRGEGLVLEHGEDAPRARLRRFEPYRFDGEWSTTCELVRGSVEDFNVVCRAGRWRADVETLMLGRRRARASVGPGHAFANVIAGRAVARVTGEEEPFELEDGDSLWVQDLVREEEIDLAGAEDGTAVLLVRIAAAGSD